MASNIIFNISEIIFDIFGLISYIKTRSTSIFYLLAETENSFITNKFETPRLDAEILISFVLDCTREYLYTWPDQEITKEQYLRIQKYVSRRLKGEPIAYIIGKKDFWSLSLKVTKDVLIPRPETELLVETVLEFFPGKLPSVSSFPSSLPSSFPPFDFVRSEVQQKSLKVLELGTGSGAIALSIAKERPHWHIVATDKSSKALEIAKKNAKTYSIHNIEFIQSDWFSNLKNYLNKTNENNLFNIIISNPPYISENDPHLKTLIPFEPKEALVSGPDGLQDIKHIIQKAPEFLFSNGLLILEHGYDQDSDVRNLMKIAGFQDVETINDIAGIGRVTLGRKP